MAFNKVTRAALLTALIFQNLSQCLASQAPNLTSSNSAELSAATDYDMVVNRSGNASNDCHRRPWRVGNDCSECADSLDGAIYCDSSELFMESLFCMAYDERIGEELVAKCPYTYTPFNHPNISTIGLYVKLPYTHAEIESSVCDRFNRQGLFCGQCKENYSLPMYPDFLKCVECNPSDYLKNWMLYIVLSYGPLTVFLILVICLRISATSAPMNSFIFISQIISQPPFQRGFIHTLNVSYLSKGAQLILRVLQSLYGIWNLTFFTALITPFCLPHQNVYRVMSLTYIEALYPLILLISVYILVELHSKNFKLVVWLWAPFSVCYTRFRRQWDIKSSIVDAFATFLLLSYVKFLFVSADILAPTKVWSKNGSTLAIASYFDARVELSADPKLIFTVIGIGLLLLVFVFLPAILLLLYPCGFCQKCLTRCRLNFQALRFLMESFYGCYSDGTDGSRDCRYFASVYLFARIAISVEYMITASTYHSAVLITCTALAVLVAAVHPYNRMNNTFNHVDPIMMLFLVVWLVCFKELHVTGGKHHKTQLSLIPLLYMSLFLPLLIMFFYAMRQILMKKWLRACCKKPQNQYERLDDDILEQRSLIPHTNVQKRHNSSSIAELLG